MDKRLNILWLASWYPNRTDAFVGDFIERHAKAVSTCVKLTVMVVVKDELISDGKVEVDRSTAGNITVYRVYYGRGSVGGIVEKINSSIRYFRLQKETFLQMVAEHGAFDLVHVHVAMKAGMLALWIKQQFNVPYVVTEHWTGYYPGAPENIYTRNFIFRYLTRKVLEKTSLLLPVSADLGKVICSHLVKVPFEVVPNVVDTSVFKLGDRVPTPFRFLHVSSLGYQKNPQGILKACKILKDGGHEFELVMIGSEVPELRALAKSLHLEQVVRFEGIVTYEEVARHMQLASAFILFSRFENLPCVILEALCSGLPVVSSRVGGIAEVINQDNGLLVPSEDIHSLADAMKQIIVDYHRYNRLAISETAAAQFNFQLVAHQHLDIYHRVLQDKSHAG